MQNTKCVCAGSLYVHMYNTMHCEKVRSSMIVIDSSDSDSDDMFEDLQSLTDAGGMLDAIAEDVNEDDNCPTAFRPKKSKDTHAGVALYKCIYNAVWAREFFFIAPVPGDPYR